MIVSHEALFCGTLIASTWNTPRRLFFLLGGIMKKHTLTSIVSFFLCKSLLAVPTIYPSANTFKTKVENNTTSNIIAESTSPKQFWVLPPNKGSSTVSDLHTINANVGFCKQLSQLQGYSSDVLEEIEELRKKRSLMEDGLTKLLENITKKKTERSKFAQKQKLEEFAKITREKKLLSLEAAELRDQLSDCKKNCRIIIDELNNLSDRIDELDERYYQIYKEHYKLADKYEQMTEVIDALQSEYDTKEQRVSKLQGQLFKLNNQYLDLYSRFGAMEGAKATITYESGWDDNIDTLRADNPGLTFERVNTRNVVINSALASISQYPGGSAILAYNLNGKWTKGQINLTSFPDGLNGNVDLSLLGACPMIHPEYFDISSDEDNPTKKMKYGLTISYEYPTAFAVKATASYNMHKMYRMVKTSKRSGGFFRSKVTNSIKIRKFFKDAFKVDWHEEDDSVRIPEETKIKLEAQWKTSIFQRMAMLAIPDVISSGNVTMPKHSKSGAIILADDLKNNKSCSRNIYCQGTIIGLRFLDGVFGSSKAQSIFEKIEDVEMKERWTRTSVVYQPWVTSYF